MGEAPRIAIDAMGGDEGISTMLSGASIALEKWPILKFDLVGDETRIKAALAAYPALHASSDVVHAAEIVEGSEKPSQAMRRSKTTSMGIAIDRVKQGHCGAAVSAGNTGALMAMSKIALRTMKGIDRPALAALLPSLGEKDFVMLDLGANTECDTRNLVEFAVMGAAYSRTALGIDRPRVSLLNIGSEEQKGTDAIRGAADQLRAAEHLHFDFKGFIEGDRISRGETDVVVCDGFTGNISLKTMEGTARFVTDLLRRAFTSSIRSKFGFLVSRPATELLKHHLDPNVHNGAVFLGLNGVVVKSHGSATDKGVANAIAVAGRLVADRLMHRISEDLDRIHTHSRANGK
jgi:phosphate acyltransferase